MIVAVIMVPVILAVVIALVSIMTADANKKQKQSAQPLAKQQAITQKATDVRSRLASSEKSDPKLERSKTEE